MLGKRTRMDYRNKLQNVKDMFYSLLDLTGDAQQGLVKLFEGETDDKQVIKVRQIDDEVRETTSDLTQLCAELVYLQQPMAKDGRLILTIIRATVDIERIVRDILHITNSKLKKITEKKIREDVQGTLGEFLPRLMEMHRVIRNASENWDDEELTSLSNIDEDVDKLQEDATKWFTKNATEGKKEDIPIYIDALFAARMMERIADHYCNIAEKLTYIVSGKQTTIK